MKPIADEPQRPVASFAVIEASIPFDQSRSPVKAEAQFLRQAIRQGKSAVLDALESRLKEESGQLLDQAKLPALH